MLAIGGRPGLHEVSAWEHFFPALPHMASGDYDTARRLLEEALTETDAAVVHYQLACVEALTGNKKHALAELEAAVEREDRFREHAAKDEDFASIRDDPRFPA